MEYFLKVEWEDNVIDLGHEKDETITMATVHMDTIDDDTFTKSQAMLMRIHIEGEINAAVKDKLREIFEWSKDLNDKTTYRKVTVEVVGGVVTPIRECTLDKVFVRDYKEVYDKGKGDEGGKFILDLTQKQNELDTVNFY